MFDTLEDSLVLHDTECTRSLEFSVPGRRATRTRDRRREVASGDRNRNRREKTREKGTELGGSVGQESASAARGTESDPQNPHKKLAEVLTLVIPPLRRQQHVDQGRSGPATWHNQTLPHHSEIWSQERKKDVKTETKMRQRDRDRDEIEKEMEGGHL